MGQVKQGPVTNLSTRHRTQFWGRGAGRGVWRKRHPQRSLPSSRAAGRPQRRHPRQASLSDEEPCWGTTLLKKRPEQGDAASIRSNNSRPFCPSSSVVLLRRLGH